MNEPRDPAFRTEPPDSDETLSAYLLGELDASGAAAFEQRLEADPVLAGRLDALAGALLSLSGADDVPEPSGFAERLEQRLHAEAAVTSLDARRRSRWQGVLTAAAGVVVLAVAGVQVLGGESTREESAKIAMESSEDFAAGAGAADEGESAAMLRDTAVQNDSYDMSAPAPAEDMPHLEAVQVPRGSAGTGGGDDAGADGDRTAGGDDAGSEQDAPPPAAMAGPAGPVIIDEGAELATDDDLRARYAGLPEGERLRGMRRDEATETAVRHAEQIRAAGPFSSSGVRPDACLDEVRGGPDARVTARVERVRWQGGEALVYLLGLPAPGSGQVDRFELWVVGPQGCETRRFLTWE